MISFCVCERMMNGVRCRMMILMMMMGKRMMENVVVFVLYDLCFYFCLVFDDLFLLCPCYLGLCLVLFVLYMTIVQKICDVIVGLAERPRLVLARAN